MGILEELDDDELEVVAKTCGWKEIGEAMSKASEEIDRAELRLMHVAKEYAGGLSEGLHGLANIYARKIELLDAMIKAEGKNDPTTCCDVARAVRALDPTRGA
jgi:hypothetical protein